MDTVSVDTRSRIMRSVTAKGNKSTERKLRSALVGAGITGWVMHDRALPGVPDFSFPDVGLAVFVDGCFWHGCPSCYRRPATSTEYWDAKVQRTRNRDESNCHKLAEIGWKVLRIWEHELKNLPSVRNSISTILLRKD